MAAKKTKMLNKLTAEQDALREVVRDEWIARALEGGTSIDLAAATEGVNWLYELAAKRTSIPGPPRILVVDSPLGAQYGANLIKTREILKERGEKPSDQDLGDSVRDSVRDSVWDSVGASVRASVWDSVWDSVWASVWDSVGDSVRAGKLEYFATGYYCGLGYDSSWTAFYEFFERIGVLDHEPFQRWRKFLKSGVWDAIWLRGFAILVRRPKVVRKDDRGRLHNPSGAAVEWNDGWKNYRFQGMRIDERRAEDGVYFEKPETITAKRVLEERNVEIRRALLTMMGNERFATEANPTVLHEDSDTVGMPRRLLRIEVRDDEPILLLEVKCPSTGKKAMLRVPHNLNLDTCHKATAWTFNRRPEDYKPVMES